MEREKIKRSKDGADVSKYWNTCFDGESEKSITKDITKDMKTKKGKRRPIPEGYIRFGRTDVQHTCRLSIPTCDGRKLWKDGYVYWSPKVEYYKNGKVKDVYIAFAKELRPGFCTSKIVMRKKSVRASSELATYVMTGRLRAPLVMEAVGAECLDGQLLKVIRKCHKKNGELWLQVEKGPYLCESISVAVDGCKVDKIYKHRAVRMIPRGYLRCRRKYVGNGVDEIRFPNASGKILIEKGYTHWFITKEKISEDDPSAYIVLSKEYTGQEFKVFSKPCVGKRNGKSSYTFLIEQKEVIDVIERLTKIEVRNGQLLKIVEYHIESGKLYLKVQPSIMYNY